MMSQLDYSKRNLAIDMLRAVTMFVMIFVNNFIQVDDIPYWMLHAKKGVDFLGLSDFVFPCFLFAVGMSIPYALEIQYSKKYSVESILGHILTRTFALWTIGSFLANSSVEFSAEMPFTVDTFRILMVIGIILLWNQYPKTTTKLQSRLYGGLKILGVVILGYLAITFKGANGEAFIFRSSILGGIGWAYLVGSVVYLFTRDRLKYIVPIFVSFVLFGLLDTPMRSELGGGSVFALPGRNFIDGILNIVRFDNGVRASLIIAGMLLTIFSVKYDTKPIKWRFGYGMLTAIVIALIGVASHHFWIAAKLGSTPPWLFYSTAISVAMYCLFRLLTHYNIESWYSLIRPAGTATLTCYIVPYALNSVIYRAGINFPEWSTTGFMSIVHCLLYSALVIFIVHLFEKVHVKLKI